MENFSTLSATVSGGSVILSWRLTGEAALATSVSLQRADFGDTDWAQIDAPALATLTYTDTAPEQGQYAYRLVVTVTQTDGKTYTLESNVVDVTVSATTGVVVLSGAVTTPSNLDLSGPANHKLVSLSWVVDDAGLNDDVLSFLVQRSLDAGVTWRDDVTTGQLSHSEELPTGTGSVQYRVVAKLPNVGTGNQLNTPVNTTSNVVTLSV